MSATATFWLTGLSGAGKSTIASALAAELAMRGERSHVLDGDAVRTGLCRDLGFSEADRAENIRRVAEVARLFNEAGLIAIVALISPRACDREMARAIVGKERFFEVYLSTSLAVCEARDPKGLYRKARAGQIQNFTGLDAPYEAPLAPALALDTEQAPLVESVARIVALLPGATALNRWRGACSDESSTDANLS
jgi:adenylyl-sulfate kinase